MSFRVLSIRRRRRLPGVVTIVAEWSLVDRVEIERRRRDLDAYYGPWGCCVGMGV